MDGQRVHVGVDDAFHEAGESAPVVGSSAAASASAMKRRNPSWHSLAQQVLLAGVAAVEGADADAGALGDCGDRCLRVLEEDVSGRVEDHASLRAAWPRRPERPLPGPTASVLHVVDLPLERIVPVC